MNMSHQCLFIDEYVTPPKYMLCLDDAVGLNRSRSAENRYANIKCNVIVLWYIIVRHHLVVDHESNSHFILSLDLSSKPVRIRDNFEWIPRFMWCACCKSHLGMIVATSFMVLGMVYGR